jgi:N-acylneuraminate cytidylyltransferase
MVSTDDEEIAVIAQKCGAQIPFMRSKKNADDYATTIDVLREVLNEYKKAEQKFDYVCCIYPTAPLIRSKRIREAKELLEKTPEAESVVPVLKYPVPVEWAMKIDNGFLLSDCPEKQLIRSQDLSPKYYDSGQFYFATTKLIQKSDNLINDHTIPIFLNDIEAQDIDTEDDWQMAEVKYQIIRNSATTNF